MSQRLEGKVAVVTGGGSGIGRESVLRFLREGAKVVIGDLNDKTAAEAIDIAASEGLGANVRFVKTNVAEEAQVSAMLDLAMTEFGRLDIVFNNAGLPGALGKIHEMRVEDWDLTFAVLVRGVFLGLKHGARVLRAQGQGGSIINTASIAGLSGGCGPHAYTSAKAAVVNLTRSVAVELARKKIRVNAICPGAILTPLVHRGNKEALEPMMAQSQPWPEAGLGEDIASAALYLASDESRFVTGAILVVDGGLTAAGPHVYRGNWEASGNSVDMGTTGL
ncbi:MAG: glucose 1-dehydrogenase [Deltaproteobacteria bacterium]|nr:glucose 1-dehydrogenase [Deltaproteobacteria bacterium]